MAGKLGVQMVQRGSSVYIPVAVFLLLLFSLGTVLTGCGDSGSEMRSSSWMGLPSDTLEGVGPSVSVVTGSSVLAAGKSMPLVVYVKDRYGHAVADGTSLVAGSKLGSGIEAVDTSGTKNGALQYTVTAASTTGVEILTFIAPRAAGTATFQIKFEAQPAPVIRVAPVADTIKVSGKLPVVVFASDRNGIPLNSEVEMFCLNGGTFDEKSGKASGGVFMTEFTAPDAQGVCWISAIVEGITASTSVAVLP